jgi:hypothetical protein
MKSISLPLPVTILICILVTTGAFGQTERWIHTYDGPGHMNDTPPCTIVGDDGNIYCAGYGIGDGTGYDIVLLSLDPAGQQRWVYRYDSEAHEGANAVVHGPDGHLYIAGQSAGPPSTTHDLIVICLDTDGAEQWVYRYDGPGHTEDGAMDIHAGADGNLYIAGYSGGVGTGYDAVVISLQPDGSQRWVYRHDGEMHGIDRAYCVTSGQNDMIYAGGYSTDISATEQLLVLALDTGGNEKWIYRGGNSYTYQNAAYALAIDPAGDLLVSGTCGTHDFTVIKLYWKTGAPFWQYTWPTPTRNQNRANAILCGDDGNVYVAGSVEAMFTMNDFVVLSLDGDGNQRWVYRHDGVGHLWDEAWSLTLGPGDMLYAAGYCRSAESTDALVVSLDDNGGLNWSRLISGPTALSNDGAESVVSGELGHIYVGGFIEQDHGRDLAVIKIDTDNTISSEITCHPIAGILPFDATVSVGVSNLSKDHVRTASARVDLTLAGGQVYSRWRTGYTNIQPEASFNALITISIPQDAMTVGQNRFRLVVEDTTHAPYNQPPYPTAGDTDTDLCTITGSLPGE